MKIPDDLLPGDHLLYFENSFVDWVIAIKTCCYGASHIEVFDRNDVFIRRDELGSDTGVVTMPGGKTSLASRNGIGVGRYPFRRKGLSYILRPSVWDHVAATAWFERYANGQRYDFLGLLCFTLAVKRGSPDRMFCSEFARNLDRPASLKSFSPWTPGDKVSPGAYLLAPGFSAGWKVDKRGNCRILETS